MEKNIAFIGARGAGKSKIARKLTKLTNRALMSIDQLIPYEQNGKSIEQIVKESGWQKFRDLEYQMLERVCKMSEVIIDCGGGILVESPTDDSSAEQFSQRKADLLKKYTTVIYIKRDWEWMMEKAAIHSGRPDLGSDYRQLLERRIPWYEKSADLILDMRNKNNITEAANLLKAKYFDQSTTNEIQI